MKSFIIVSIITLLFSFTNATLVIAFTQNYRESTSSVKAPTNTTATSLSNNAFGQNVYSGNQTVPDAPSFLPDQPKTQGYSPTYPGTISSSGKSQNDSPIPGTSEQDSKIVSWPPNIPEKGVPAQSSDIGVGGGKPNVPIYPLDKPYDISEFSSQKATR